MWRRLPSQLRTLSLSRSAVAGTASSTPSPAPLRPSFHLINRHFSSQSETVVSKKTVEDVNPVATGHEREELEAELEGRRILDIDFPEGPFGTKEEPAVVKSYYDKRIVGCPGAEGEDEHDVVWFWLEKGKPHECAVCEQYFVCPVSRKVVSAFSRNRTLEMERREYNFIPAGLEVVGPGGPPDGHGDDDEDHHH